MIWYMNHLIRTSKWQKCEIPICKKHMELPKIYAHILKNQGVLELKRVLEII